MTQGQIGFLLGIGFTLLAQFLLRGNVRRAREKQLRETALKGMLTGMEVLLDIQRALGLVSGEELALVHQKISEYMKTYAEKYERKVENVG